MYILNVFSNFLTSSNFHKKIFHRQPTQLSIFLEHDSFFIGVNKNFLLSSIFS